MRSEPCTVYCYVIQPIGLYEVNYFQRLLTMSCTNIVVVHLCNKHEL